MGSENSRIDKYQYEIHQDIDRDRTRDLAFLSLFDRQRKLLCAIAFVPDEQELTQPEESANGHVAMQMHEKHFARVLDMLRNEKPVYFGWWREAQSMHLSTAKEPVGEQEMRKLFSFLYV